MMGAEMERFLQFMKDYTDFMEQMVTLEDNKYGALISNDLTRMDKAISAQQAMLMKLEKLEEQRAGIQAEAGWEGMTFQEILDRTQGAEHRQLETLFSRISRMLEQIQYSNDKAMTFAKMNLHVNDMLGESGQQGYAAGGERKGDGDAAGTMFETKI